MADVSRTRTLLPESAVHVETGYKPFPNLGWRNGLHASLEVPAMVRALRLPVGARILEVGCGRGMALAAIARLCQPRLHAAIDLEPDVIAEARTHAAEARLDVYLDVADIRDLPFENGSFDVVIDFGTCYHIDRPETALREIARVLDYGGLFVHETPFSQLIAHPIRTRGRALPFAAARSLQPLRWAGLWAAREKRRMGRP